MILEIPAATPLDSQQAREFRTCGRVRTVHAKIKNERTARATANIEPRRARLPAPPSVVLREETPPGNTTSCIKSPTQYWYCLFVDGRSAKDVSIQDDQQPENSGVAAERTSAFRFAAKAGPIPRQLSRSALLFRQRSGANFCDRRRRRDGFAVDGEADDRRLAAGLRLLEGVGEILGALDRDAEAAEGPRVSREIGIAQIGRRDAAGIFALLMHADGAVHAVVGNDGDERRAVLHGGSKF